MTLVCNGSCMLTTLNTGISAGLADHNIAALAFGAAERQAAAGFLMHALRSFADSNKAVILLQLLQLLQLCTLRR
jgi:predicted Na+-dependent transporter